MMTRRQSAGFTLLELLVVLAIVAVFLGLLIPAIQRARAAVHRAACGDNLRQIGLAFQAYHDAHGVLPPGIRRLPDPYPFLGWGGRLLPYLDQGPLWTQAQNDYAREPAFWVPPRHAGGSVVVPVFVCPADGRGLGVAERGENGFEVAFTHYLGVMGATRTSRDGVLFLDSQVRLADITDGTSTTLIVGERPPSPDSWWGWWYAGVGQDADGSSDMLLGVRDYRTTFRTPTCPHGPYSYGPGNPAELCDIFHFWSQHSGGAHFLMADGSVHFVSYAAADLLPALASRRGGEAVSLPE